MRYKVFYPTNYSLSKTIRSGQMFRWYEQCPNRFKLLAGSEYCFVEQAEEFGPVKLIAQDLDFWYEFLSLSDTDVDYKMFEEIMNSTEILHNVYEYSRGIRLLRQLPWETLVEFIISQRNNIPRIKLCVERITQKLGYPLDMEHSSFPPASAFIPGTLADCGLGYREPYVYTAAGAVRSKEIELDKLTAKAGCTSMRALQELERLHGVGSKVARCVALFGLGHTDLFPVDVWISRAIEQNIVNYVQIDTFGAYKGLVQQYVFYYMLNNR